MLSARTFFTPEQQEDIRLAIMNAELDTSGEIRVHIEYSCKGEVLDRAAFVFEELGMRDTEFHNGVLFYLAVKNRKFAVLGDSAINQLVPENFWNGIKNRMMDKFRESRFTEGLVDAITETGQQLKFFFPYQTDDVNELPDDISFS